MFDLQMISQVFHGIGLALKWAFTNPYILALLVVGLLGRLLERKLRG